MPNHYDTSKKYFHSKRFCREYTYFILRKNVPSPPLRKYFFVFYKNFRFFAFLTDSPMDKVTLFDKTFKPYISNEEIEKAIDKVAEKLNGDFGGSDEIPILLCVLNGSIMFTGELMKRLNFHCQLVSVKMTSYEGTSSTGHVKTAMGLTADITGRKVIIVEDIVDTGETIVELKRILKEKGAKESYICTLLFKEEAYKKDAKIDYAAINIENRFIVGFGLDYNELGRNLKDIWILDA